MARFTTVDEYISSFPSDVQATLQAVRQTMRTAAPGTEETISYDIPTLTLGGRYVVYFAGWKHHISVYPVPAVEGQLGKDLEPYVAGKGTLKFPLDKPIPFDLIEQVVRLLIEQRVAEKV